MSTNEVQGRLIGGPTGESATIETSGRIIRPALQIPNALVDELRLRVRSDEIYLRAVDPANVGMVEMTIHEEAFEDFHFDADDEITVGSNVADLKRKLSNARLGKETDDPVELDIDETRTVIEIEREYADTKVRYANELLNYDPDSIREEPDVPDMDLPAIANVNVDAYKDAIDHIDSSSDHAVYREHGGSFLLTGATHDDSPSPFGSAVEFENVVDVDEESDDVVAKYSLDYLVDFAKALKRAKIDEISITWGPEFPQFIEFERRVEDGVAYEGEFCLAPRLHKE